MNRNVVVLAIVILVITGMLISAKYLSRPYGGPGGAAVSRSAVQGTLAPEFELKTLDGKTLHLSDFRGKAVLLNFWATWCGPCKIEIPWFVELQNRYGPQGLQIIGISMDDGSPEKVAAFARDMSVNYPVVMGDDKVSDQYGGVEGLPTTFYIGRDGKIVKRVAGLVGHGEVEENIRAALKQGGETAQARSPEPARGTATK